MFLNEWAEKNGVKPRAIDRPDCDPMMIVADRRYPDRAGLWHLADWYVSTVTGGSIWLGQRTVKA